MKSLWVTLSVFLLIVVGVSAAVRLLGIDVAGLTPDRARDVVLSFGIWAPAIYLVAYGQPIIPLPASLMTIAGGLAFGPFWGMLASLVGATIRACTEFGVARLFGRDAVAKLLRGNIARLDQHIGKNGFQTVLLIRLIPNVPFDLQNYGLGFSRVRFVPYALATLLGMVPGSFAFVYLGYSLTDPKRIWKLLIAILLVIGLTVVTTRWKRSAAARISQRR
ncbi:MAG: TVP38/TMEM64 family protein [Candidatus Omnitrophica bacterium]|nr:TVP38/TMEM64 family protein [Candidatus Omnitrophota bacterium]